jgi:uncharacterized membrane protein
MTSVSLARGTAWLAMLAMALLVAHEAFRYLLSGRFDGLFHQRYLAVYPVVLAHGLASLAALALGPTQFWPWLRRREPRLHRDAGKMYLLCVGVGGATGLVMGARALGGLPAKLAFCTFAVLWLATAALAWRAAGRRRFGEHRAWMVRNYALTFAAVVLRVSLHSLQDAGFTLEEVYPYLGWLSWGASLMAAEALLRLDRRKAPSTGNSQVLHRELRRQGS